MAAGKDIRNPGFPSPETGADTASAPGADIVPALRGKADPGQRRADALRQNLLRRKAQARARDTEARARDTEARAQKLPDTQKRKDG